MAGTYGRTKLVLGIVFLCLLVPCDALGIGMWACPSHADDASTGFGFAVFGLVAFGVPAAILLALGLRDRKRGRSIDHIAALARASARIPLQTIAADLGLTQPEARKLLLDAIHHGRIAGRLDLEHGTFISGGAHSGVQKLAMRCGQCGGTAEVVVGAGFATNCPFCGTRLA
jgi:hypothetical protein